MNPHAELDGYLDQVRSALRRVLYARGVAVAVGSLLLLTALATFVLMRTGFPASVVLASRVVGVVLLAGCVGGLWYALRQQQRDDAAAALERVLPDQDGRIETYLQERRRAATGTASPLIDLLAEDARRVSERTPPGEAVPVKRWALPAGGAAAVVIALGTLIFAGPGLWGDGARRLWLGVKPPAARLAEAAGGIAVTPGDITVRRNQDLPVEAQVAGGTGAQLHVRFGEGGEWEAAPMESDGKGGYVFTLYALREQASYYVSSGRLKSREHRIDVVDLPQIESLRLTYEYPKWTGLKQRVQESGGDIRAVEGTRVNLEVVTNTPMESPLLVVNGNGDGMQQRGVSATGSLTVSEPGHYRIATRFGDEIVALTEDFVVDLVPDEKPNVEIVKPGRDYQATNIEEVPVNVKAQDDFRLEGLELRYSVNGGEWRSEKLDAGATDIQAAALLRLEEMQQAGKDGSGALLVPGDLVSYYAVARDRRHSVQTDLFLIQVQPFDRRFTQGQGGGGGAGGGGGDDEGQISQRQREVLLATWNLQRAGDGGDEREKERRADSARMLAEVQNTLADQANTLVERARARLLTGADENIKAFVDSLAEAVKAMRPAAERLTERDLEQAVAHEQRALQHLLRAESTFRDIQVAQQRGGGGGGGGQAGRDVAEMTELELDLEKNQYETEPQMTAQQQGEAENETLRRLRELARRQEQLAREAARNAARPEQQRWQQEQLRREAEELRRQLEQLAQQQRGSQGQQAQRGQQGQQGQSGQSSGSASSVEQAADQVAQAMQDMQSGDPERVRRASEQLNRAREQLERSRSQAVGESFEDLQRSARALAERQRQTEEQLRAAIGSAPPASIANPNARNNNRGITWEQAERLAAEKRNIQSQLEALQRQMRATGQRARERAPEAAERLGEAGSALDEAGTASGLARSAMEIERGRVAQAAMRDALITESLEQLQGQLGEAARVASTEGGRSAPGEQAEPGELLAELGELRRAIESARAQANQRGNGDRQQPGQPGQRGEPGQGEPGEGQPGGESGEGRAGQSGSPGQQASGQGGGRGGMVADRGTPGGGGGLGGARAGHFIEGDRGRIGAEVPRFAPGQELQPQVRASSERLGRLRELLRPGALTDEDISALRELSDRLRRAGGDPMAEEYRRMVSLVNQLELAALRAERADSGSPNATSADVIDDSRRYRDNVAEYYRRLGGANDR